MKKYKITAQAAQRNFPLLTIGEERSEIISTGNKLFKECKNKSDVERVFLSFWNELNPSSNEIVIVKKIEKVN